CKPSGAPSPRSVVGLSVLPSRCLLMGSHYGPCRTRPGRWEGITAYHKLWSLIGVSMEQVRRLRHLPWRARNLWQSHAGKRAGAAHHCSLEEPCAMLCSDCKLFPARLSQGCQHQLPLWEQHPSHKSGSLSKRKAMASAAACVVHASSSTSAEK